MLPQSKACYTLLTLDPYKAEAEMRQFDLRYSLFLNLTILCSLFATSCTPPPTSLQATQTPEIIAITDTPANTPTPEATEESKLPADEIDTRMAKLVDFIPLAGLAIGIQYKGDIYEQGYGVANAQNGKPVTPATVFKIASLTKSFTAAAILRLSQEGKLRLDDPISRFLPETHERAQDVQVQHLLNHTSGLPDWSIDAAQEALPETFTTDEAVTYYFSTIQNLESEPGEASSYNNAAYFLLGAIIEKASGLTYKEYLTATFFEPLGLHSSGECGSQADVLGYHSVNRQLEEARPSNLKLLGAAGNLCSTAGDLLNWLDALRQGKVIRPETWERMIKPTELTDGQVAEYGFGLVIEEDTLGREISHDGVTAGFNSFFIYYPEHELSIVLLTNTDGFDPALRGIASSLATDLLRE
jgi:D-alanyl-D-alanine carboxypeptidase